MPELFARISSASLQALQSTYAPFLGRALSLDVKGRDEVATILYPALCNLEPDGYGSDIRKAFLERDLGGYLLSNPFQMNPDLTSINGERNSIISDLLPSTQTNSVEDTLLYAHNKIGLRLIRATSSTYQIHFSTKECMVLLERFAVGTCNANQYSEIAAAINTSHYSDQQSFETAEALIDQIAAEIKLSRLNLWANDGFKRIVAGLIGYRTARVNLWNAAKKIFLTSEQLACMDSESRIQIIHGDCEVGKTTTLLLKLHSVAQHAKEGENITIIVANQTQADRFELVIRAFSRVNLTFHLKWTIKENLNGFEFPLNGVKSLDCDWLFFDDLSAISHKALMWLAANEKLHLVCVLRESVPRGLQHSCGWFQWIHLSGHGVTNKTTMRQIQNFPSFPFSPGNRTQAIEKDYFSMSRSIMDRFYPDWMCTVNKTTICIPASMDILYGINAQDCEIVEDEERFVIHRETEKDKARYGSWAQVAGRKAESVILQAFQRLNLSGVLVAAFNTRDFWNKVRNSKDLLIDARIREKITQFLDECKDFESDFLFFHPYLGICVIEVKASKNICLKSSQYQKGVCQLEKMVYKKIPALYKILTDEEMNIPICGAMCFPNSDLIMLPLNTINNSWLHLDKRVISNDESFREFWLQKINKRADNNFFENAAFQRFICAIVAYRSSAIISHAINALKIYDILDSQKFFSASVAKTSSQENGCSPPRASSVHQIILQDNKQRTFFLNDKQLAIYEKESESGEIEIICGPPGTGKTLLIILKALKAAKETRPGRVLVKTIPALVPKLRMILMANRLPNDRAIVVLDSLVDNQDDRDEDDYFADEFDMARGRQEILKRRAFCKGRNVVAITGAAITSDIPKIRETFEAQKEFKCFVHELRQVVRGTDLIVKFWKTDLPLYNLSMGHNAVGRPIEYFCLKNSDSILHTILEKVRSLLVASTILLGAKFCPRDLAIIVPNHFVAEYVKNFLAANKILCGSAEEQLSDYNLIAVEYFYRALSHEWPVVLAVDLMLTNAMSPFKIIASSRAIAHLIRIERDQNFVQNIIDRTMNKQFNGRMEGVAMRDIFNVVVAASKQVGETENTVIYHDFLYFLARTGFMPHSLRAIEPFRNCLNFSDFLNVLINNEYLIYPIAVLLGAAERQQVSAMRRRGRGRADVKYVAVVSKRFIETYAKAGVSKKTAVELIKLCGKTQENLTRERDRFGSIKPSRAGHSQCEERVLMELSNTYDWHEMIKVIEKFFFASYYAYYIPVILRD